MTCGAWRPPLPSPSSYQALQSLGTGSRTSKQSQQASSPTSPHGEGRSRPSPPRAGKWPASLPGSMKPLLALQPRPVSTATGLLLGKRRELCPLYLPDTLSHSAIASLGPSTQRETRHKLPETALQGPQTAIFIIITVRAAKVARTRGVKRCGTTRSPGTGGYLILSQPHLPSVPPSSQPRKGCGKLRLPRSHQDHPDLSRGPGKSDAGGDTPPRQGRTGRLCLLLKTSRSAANDGVPGTVINFILLGLHPTPRLAGGRGGKKKGKRKAHWWAAGPHPARPRAPGSRGLTGW